MFSYLAKLRKKSIFEESILQFHKLLFWLPIVFFFRLFFRQSVLSNVPLKSSRPWNFGQYLSHYKLWIKVRMYISSREITLAYYLYFCLYEKTKENQGKIGLAVSYSYCFSFFLRRVHPLFNILSILNTCRKQCKHFSFSVLFDLNVFAADKVRK